MTDTLRLTPVRCDTCLWWAAMRDGEQGLCQWHAHFPLYPVRAAGDGCTRWQRAASEPPDASVAAMPGGAA